MNESLAARRRAALKAGFRFIWDRTVSSEGRVTGYYGFVVTPGGSFIRANVHDTETEMMGSLISVAEAAAA